MISIQEAEEIHKILIDTFGGAHGIRDKPALDSALTRPFQTFNGTELYPEVIDKTAALLESLLINHPFIDGNKRIGYAIARLFLLQNGMDFNAGQDEKYAFIISIASGELKYEQIEKWLKMHTDLV